MSAPARPLIRLLALAAALALALGAAACGGDSDDGGDKAASVDEQAKAAGKGGDGKAGEPGGRDDDAGDGGDEEQARAAVEGLYDDLAAGDAAGVCAVMDRDAQKQVEQSALAGGGKGKKISCEESFARFLSAAQRNGGLKQTLNARIGSVEVKGETAIAKVTFGKAQAGQIPLRKLDGEWKLAAAGAAPSQ